MGRGARQRAEQPVLGGKAGCGAGRCVRRCTRGGAKTRGSQRGRELQWAAGCGAPELIARLCRGRGCVPGGESQPSRLEKTRGVTGPTPAHPHVPKCRIPVDLNAPRGGGLCPGQLCSAGRSLELKRFPALSRPQGSSGVSSADRGHLPELLCRGSTQVGALWVSAARGRWQEAVRAVPSGLCHQGCAVRTLSPGLCHPRAAPRPGALLSRSPAARTWEGSPERAPRWR